MNAQHVRLLKCIMQCAVAILRIVSEEFPAGATAGVNTRAFERIAAEARNILHQIERYGS